MQVSNQGIKSKLGFLVFGSTGALILFAIYAYSVVAHLKEDLDHLGYQRIPITEIKGNLRAGVHATARFMWRALAAEMNSDARASSLKKATHTVSQILVDWDKIVTYKLSEDVKTRYISNKILAEQYYQTVTKEIALLSANTPESDGQARAHMFAHMVEGGNKITDFVEEIGQISTKKTIEFIEEATKDTKRAQAILILFAIVTGLIISVFGMTLASNISRRLIKITSTVGDASTQVLSASGQLSNSADQLSSSAQQQASALEETSAALTEIAGMVESNSKGADTANQTAKNVYSTTESTCSSMGDLASAMKAILESNQKIEKLVKIIESIGEKTEVIDEIVFETRLLSFNASVEAERAGEYGRGFAVVAQEVGNLAQMSGKAATEISSIVKQSIKEAEEVARENKNRVEMGGKLAQDTNESMAKVLEQIKSILESTGKIANASKEQSIGINQITESLDTLNQSTQETAGTAEESASASEELSGQAESLMGQVNELQIVVLGRSQESDSATSGSERTHEKSRSNNVVKLRSAPQQKSEIKKVANGGSQPELVANNQSGDGWEKL